MCHLFAMGMINHEKFRVANSKSTSVNMAILFLAPLEHYKHVAIGIATMTVHDLQLNQVSRFIILSK